MPPVYKLGDITPIDLDARPLAFALKPQHCSFHWIEPGSRWRFPDAKFMELREDIGLNTHVIHFHDRIVMRGPFMWAAPVIEFSDRAKLLEFKLRL